ncbi:hypothetical protein ASG73_11750 [Janibacter sp. Soil728]|uniref:hypothetical protein n=1 Tax=Janibacter sp. Soil728 TaxID=1736393 RepID=UPI0006FB34A0|nr:hypothetical protein [Janibacter sp. Soil728]KRE36982.1 hypothetical protein ASG73_11750 [Janibacter sp. Soil728]
MIRMAQARGAFRSRSTAQELVAAGYVLTVAVVATVGFVTESTAGILLAALLSLPASVIALPSYYVAYGLLALIPGANPSESSGSGACNTDGVDCQWSSTGDLAGWFHVTTEVIGILALTCAAVLNVLAICIVTALARGRESTKP